MNTYRYNLVVTEGTYGKVVGNLFIDLNDNGSIESVMTKNQDVTDLSAKEFLELLMSQEIIDDLVFQASFDSQAIDRLAEIKDEGDVA